MKKIKPYLKPLSICGLVVAILVAPTVRDHFYPNVTSYVSDRFHKVTLPSRSWVYITHSIDNNNYPQSYEGSCLLGENAVMQTVATFTSDSIRRDESRGSWNTTQRASSDGDDYTLYHFDNPNNDPVPHLKKTANYCDREFFAITTPSHVIASCNAAGGCDIGDFESLQIIDFNGDLLVHRDGLGKVAITDLVNDFNSRAYTTHAPRIFEGASPYLIGNDPRR